MTYAMMAFGLICSAVFIWMRDNKGGAKPLVIKLLSSLFFVLTAISAFIENELNSFLPLLVILGMVFAVGGDVVLDLKITYPADSKIYTTTGMLLFLVTQICYIGALSIVFSTHWAVFIAAILVAAAIMLVSKFLLKFNFGKDIYAASAYAFMLCATVAQALFVLITAASAFSALFFSGAVLFLLSDALLSLTYFGGDDRKIVIALNHASYYAAQFLIALSLLFI